MTVDLAVGYNRSELATTHARSSGEAELLQTQRRRRDARDGERAAPRRARRRRQSAPWLQRNALGLVAISMLVALLGLGFGLLQLLTRPESTPAVVQPEPTATSASTANLLSAPSSGAGAQLGAPAPLVQGPPDSLRTVHSSTRVLDANYTVAAGDTLVQIASRFGTTVDRVQAFNNLIDPRALRIGTKLVIPPPLQP